MSQKKATRRSLALIECCDFRLLQRNFVNNTRCHWRMFTPANYAYVLYPISSIDCCQNIDIVIEIMRTFWSFSIQSMASDNWNLNGANFVKCFQGCCGCFVFRFFLFQSLHLKKLLPIRQQLQYFLCVKWNVWMGFFLLDSLLLTH